MFEYEYEFDLFYLKWDGESDQFGAGSCYIYVKSWQILEGGPMNSVKECRKRHKTAGYFP